MIKITVPASSANLGVGFDCLGVALDVYAEFSFAYSDVLSIDGCSPEYQNENNLVYRSYLHASKFLALDSKPILININSDIPEARGLGSSASCVVAGVLAAYSLSNTPLNYDDILYLCNELEGHPDNVAPALLGGLIASAQFNDQIYTQEYQVHSKFSFIILVPNFEVATEHARKVLPDTVKHKDAVSNQTKLLFAMEAFAQGDSLLLKNCLKDALHEPYRMQLIHEYEVIKAILEESGALETLISGSGPTLLGIFDSDIPTSVISTRLEELEYKWTLNHVRIDTRGAHICLTNI